MGVLYLLCSDPVLSGEKAREREKKWRKMLEKWPVWIGPKKHKVGHNRILFSLRLVSFTPTIINCVLLRCRDGSTKRTFRMGRDSQSSIPISHTVFIRLMGLETFKEL